MSRDKHLTSRKHIHRTHKVKQLKTDVVVVSYKAPYARYRDTETKTKRRPGIYNKGKRHIHTRFLVVRLISQSAVNLMCSGEEERISKQRNHRSARFNCDALICAEVSERYVQ